ncbi:MAG: secretion protein [Flavobacterium sp.]
MKSINKLSLVAAFFIASVHSYAINGEFFLNVKNTKGNEISFSMNGIEKAAIAIYDAEDNLIFSENAQGHNGIIKHYNLADLPMGTYTLVVKTDLKEVKHDIKVASSNAVLSQRPYLEVYKNTFDSQSIVSK